MHEIKMYIMFTLINVNEISTFFEEIAAAKSSCQNIYDVPLGAFLLLFSMTGFGLVHFLLKLIPLNASLNKINSFGLHCMVYTLHAASCGQKR